MIFPLHNKLLNKLLRIPVALSCVRLFPGISVCFRVFSYRFPRVARDRWKPEKRKGNLGLNATYNQKLINVTYYFRLLYLIWFDLNTSLKHILWALDYWTFEWCVGGGGVWMTLGFWGFFLTFEFKRFFSVYIKSKKSYLLICSLRGYWMNMQIDSIQMAIISTVYDIVKCCKDLLNLGFYIQCARPCLCGDRNMEKGI